MSIIKAPFNFVPLSEKVYFPDWADQISQDIPFSDGVSGTIDLKITAESPIFIRNGHTKEDGEKKNDNYNSFSHVTGPDGKPVYFIPATSIKGEVRTLLEIMSFGKITVDKSAMFARRDLTKGADYELKGNQGDIHCGWLKRKDNRYVITDCGQPYRISHKYIDDYLDDTFHSGRIFTEHFSQSANFEPKDKISIGENFKVEKSSTYYKRFLIEKYEDKLQNVRFSELPVDSNEKYDKRKKVRFNSKGNIVGTLVVTGQPGGWLEDRAGKKNAGKFYEFVFGAPIKNSEGEDIEYLLSDESFGKYKFIYDDISVEFKEFSHNDRKVLPVFFRVEKCKIKDFGLTYLYKLPYKNSVYESLKNGYELHKEHKLDLAQCIFGYTDSEEKKEDSKNDSLKGRVQFGNAIAVNVEKGEKVELVLGKPMASYVPIYVNQRDKNGDPQKYDTYDNSTLNGWKRYHIRNSVWKKMADLNREGKNTQNSEINPLGKGTTFKDTITFHNLKPTELGALIVALTFFNNTESCFHQLGQAKPYGYGLCKYEIEKLNVFNFMSKNAEKTDAKEYMKSFENTMNDFLGKGSKWNRSEQIKQLMTIASRFVSKDDERFKYMGLDEYSSAKEAFESLPLATSRGLEEFVPNSLRKSVSVPNSDLSFVEGGNFGEWEKTIKAYGENHDGLNENEKQLAFEILKNAKELSVGSSINKWAPKGEYFKRCKKLKLIGKELATEWFEKL